MTPPPDPALERFWSSATKAWRVGLWAGLASFALYAATLDRVVSCSDPAELQTLARTGGIAHAGYPTFVLLLKAVGAIPIGPLAWRANLLTAAFGALAVGLLAYAAQRWTGRRMPSLVAAGAFAMAITSWKEATLAGVHAFTLALDAALLLLALRYAWRPAPGLAALAALLYGLGITSHLPALALGAPLLLAFVAGLRRVPRRAPHVALAAFALVAGLSPFAYTVAMDRPEQPMNYVHDTLEPGEEPFAVERPDLRQRLQRLHWLLSGKQYLSVTRRDLPTLAHSAAHVASVVVMNELPLVGAILAVAGFVLLLGVPGTPRLLVAAWFVPAAVLALLGGTELTLHYFIQPCLWLLCLGLAVALAALEARRRAWSIAAAVFVLAAPLLRLAIADPPGPLARFSMWRWVWSMAPKEWSPFRDDLRPDAYGRGVMQRLPARAVVLGSRFEECETLRYFLHGEPLRADVEVWYAGLEAPRFGRLRREAERAGRPVYFTRLPRPEVLEGARAELVWDSGWHQLWRVARDSTAAPGRMSTVPPNAAPGR